MHRNVNKTLFCIAILNQVQLVTRKPSCRWQTCATRKHAKIAPIRRAYVVADNTSLSSFV